MSTACGRPQGGGDPAHVDACEQGVGGGKKPIFVDVINGWLLSTFRNLRLLEKTRCPTASGYGNIVENK